MSGPRRSWSLRARLVAISAFVGIATLLFGGAAMFRADHQVDKKILDARLVALAQTVHAFADHEIEANSLAGRGEPVRMEVEGNFGTRYHYQIWSLDGRLLLQSHKDPVAGPMRPLSERGFNTSEMGGEEVRTYSEAGPNAGTVIQIAERMADRSVSIATVSKYFLAFMAIPICLIVGCTWWLLNRTLRSVDDYARQLRERHALDLSELRAANPPSELAPMVDSINTLLERFRQTLSVEREFTAIAAHEMRTPLAGLRAQAQLAATHSGSPQEMKDCLSSLMAGIDQASHLIDRLLDLARIDALAAAGCHAIVSVNLGQVDRKVMTELAPAAAEREVSLKTRFEVQELSAAELGLRMLVHNLLANAIRYTPRGGQIEIASALHAEGVLLTVDDSGPGIPASRHAEAFQRFNRLGRSDAHGVGLGLSIVQAVAHAHQAVVRLLESPLGGLRAEVRFPVMAAPVGAGVRVSPADAHIWRPGLRKVEVTGSTKYSSAVWKPPSM